MQLTPTQATLLEWRLCHMARATVLARPAADLRRVAGDLEKAEGKGVYKFIGFLCSIWQNDTTTCSCWMGMRGQDGFCLSSLPGSLLLS